MRKRIEIKDMRQVATAEGAEIAYDLSIGQSQYELKYNISGISGLHVPQRVDGVVVTFLLYALRHDMDIVSVHPISEQLYFNITKNIIPQIVCCDKNAHDIKLIMPTTSEKLESSNRRGTGLSLGIDSFTTLHEYGEDALSDNYRLTDLVHLKTGAHHGMIGRFDKEVEDRLFHKENEKVRAYCKKYGHNLITIETNLFEITCKEFGWNFDTTHIVRNLGTIMVLQNYFDKYYYASAMNLDQFSINLSQANAHMEKWLIPLLSTENVTFYSANSAMNRVEKTEYISKFEDTYDHLHVCWHEEKNCGECAKCIRTLVALDAMGVLDKYAKSFDLEQYYKNRWKLIKRVVALRRRDTFYMEVYKLLKEKKVKVPNAIAVAFTYLSIRIKDVLT